MKIFIRKRSEKKVWDIMNDIDKIITNYLPDVETLTVRYSEYFLKLTHLKKKYHELNDYEYAILTSYLLERYHRLYWLYKHKEVERG